MMTVDVHPGTAVVEWSLPRALFKIPEAQLTDNGFTVSPDGQQFIVVAATTPSEPQRFTTLLNWMSLVK